ncbi:MAG: M20/M25/M40 family metallo-hydrolase, partial [Casimicrobiaceae bacterium]
MPASAAFAERIATQWDSDIVPRLVEYVRIPAKSPHFDPAWETHGYLEQVVRLAETWARAQPVRGLEVEIVRIAGRTPLLMFRTAGVGKRTVLIYGHLDKQPEMTGWRADGGSWVPILEGEKLYGRGAADDGYAVFAALSAIAALDAESIPHAPCVGLIEACEESGSYDLPAYLALLRPRLGDVDLVVGLDSGCGDYDRLWVTTSLRGLAAGTLKVEVLTEGVHSGDASGIVPSSFRVARRLIDRLEDAANGWILPSAFHAQIPTERVEQAGQAAAILGATVFR